MKCKKIFELGWENYPYLKVVRTCHACPEQYDVIYKKEHLGHLRLRYGCFTATYITYAGKLVYKAYPKGDGIFESDERDFHINHAIYHLLKERKKEMFKEQYR